MSVDAALFGTAYLDAESFRNHAALFGVQMSFGDYPDDSSGNADLLRVLQAASRAIDAFCGKAFTPDNLTETHALDTATWQFSVNSPPVSEIVSCAVRYAIDGTLTIVPANVYINNQQGYCEITRTLDGTQSIIDQLGTAIQGPQVEVVYKSLQTVPNDVKLATGYQAGHMINSGFVNKVLPPDFGKLDIGGLEVNNRKGYQTPEQREATTMSPDAVNLLQNYKRFVAA